MVDLYVERFSLITFKYHSITLTVSDEIDMETLI